MNKMDIKLFEPEDMKTGRGGGKKGTGEKYAKYRNAIAPHVAFLKEGIAAAKDGSIRVRVADLAKAMGMVGKHETSIYWGLKYVLFAEDLVVTTGQTKDNEPVLIVREKKEGDVLPASLTKHMGSGSAAETDAAESGAEE
jgi:hypothetical protein